MNCKFIQQYVKCCKFIQHGTIQYSTRSAMTAVHNFGGAAVRRPAFRPEVRNWTGCDVDLLAPAGSLFIRLALSKLSIIKETFSTPSIHCKDRTKNVKRTFPTTELLICPWIKSDIVRLHLQRTIFHVRRTIKRPL